MKFILVRWLEEENLSVLPTTSARSGEKVHTGAFGQFKWGGGFMTEKCLEYLVSVYSCMPFMF